MRNLKLELKALCTHENPGRASSLGMLNCGLRFLLQMIDENRHLEAANTGNLFHFAVDEWLKTSSVERAVRAIDAAQQRFREKGTHPGDKEKAEKWLKKYVADPRNAPLGEWPKDRTYGKVILSETPVALSIPPASFDKTGQNVWITGTLDQLREDEYGDIRVWDLKTSKMAEDREPHDLIHFYFPQVLAYTVGAMQMAKEKDSPFPSEKVKIGGLIIPRSYMARKAVRKRVFYKMPSIPRRAVDYMLSAWAEHIALLRNGVISPVLSTECGKCYVTNGPAECTVRLDHLLKGQI